MHTSSYGSFAFALGFLIAVFIGIIGAMSTPIIWFLIGLGVAIGIINWLWNDPLPFLLASLAIVLVSYYGQSGLILANTMLVVLTRLGVVFMPVALINALKLVFDKMHKI